MKRIQKDGGITLIALVIKIFCQQSVKLICF